MPPEIFICEAGQGIDYTIQLLDLRHDAAGPQPRFDMTCNLTRLAAGSFPDIFMYRASGIYDDDWVVRLTGTEWSTGSPKVVELDFAAPNDLSLTGDVNLWDFVVTQAVVIDMIGGTPIGPVYFTGGALSLMPQSTPFGQVTGDQEHIYGEFVGPLELADPPASLRVVACSGGATVESATYYDPLGPDSGFNPVTATIIEWSTDRIELTDTQFAGFDASIIEMKGPLNDDVFFNSGDPLAKLPPPSGSPSIGVTGTGNVRTITLTDVTGGSWDLTIAAAGQSMNDYWGDTTAWDISTGDLEDRISDYYDSATVIGTPGSSYVVTWGPFVDHVVTVDGSLLT